MYGQIPPPLRKSQVKAIEFVRRNRLALIWGWMGIGKTRIAIEIANRLAAIKRVTNVLVVCPKSVIGVWESQYLQYGGGTLRLMPFKVGTTKKKAAMIRTALPGYMAVFNYEAIWREPLAKALRLERWDMIIMDEVHRIKAPGSKVSRFAHSLTWRNPNAVLLGLSGTPFPNGPMDAYGVFRFIDDSLFGTRFVDFRERYAVMGGFQGYEVKGYQNMDEFDQKIASRTIKIESNVVDFPGVIDQDVPILLPAKARKAYAQMEREFYLWLHEQDKNAIAVNAAAKIMKLQQITSGFVRSIDLIDVPLHTEKLGALEDIIDGTDEPIVIFCRFVFEISMIREMLEKRNIPIVSHEDFVAGKSRVFMAQIQSHSEGIDLTRCGDRQCRRAVYYSIGYVSPALYLQSRARIHRPGQKQTVIYHHLIATNTIDEKVYECFDRKADLVKSIMSQVKKEEN